MRTVTWQSLICSLSLIGSQAMANVTGSDLQNFNAAYAKGDHLTVHSGKTLGKGRLSLGLFANHAINTLPYFNEEGRSNVDQLNTFNDSVSGLEFTVSLGLTDWWDISVALPGYISQSVEDNQQLHGYFDRLGLTEVRFASRFHLLEYEKFNLAFLATANHNRVEQNPYSGNTAWPAMSTELLGSYDFGFLTWSVNIGYRFHKGEPSEVIKQILPIQRFGDQHVASTGVDIPIPGRKLSLQTEIYGSYSPDEFSQFSPRNSSILEGVIGARYDLNPSTSLYGGYGKELRHSLSSADQRVYLGLRWMTDLAWSKQASEKTVAQPISQPAPKPLPITERSPDAQLVVDDVYFLFDSTKVRTAQDYVVLKKLGELLTSDRGIDRVLIEGHTCAIGTDEYNLALSDRRAEAIERWLFDKYHLPREKLLTIGWGEKHPKASNALSQGRMQNRRAVFKFYYQKAAKTQAQPVSTFAAKRKP